MAEAIDALAERVKAADPVACLIVWEARGGTVHMAALPESIAVRMGLVELAYAEIFPPAPDAE